MAGFAAKQSMLQQADERIASAQAFGHMTPSLK
jgi:hypothetical protein